MRRSSGIPQQIDTAKPGNRANHFQSVVGKLKPGVNAATALRPSSSASWWNKAGTGRRITTPSIRSSTRMLALPYQDEVIGNVKPAMLMMLGAVASCC